MHSLDPDVVRTWFDTAVVIDLPPHLAVVPDADERAVLGRGRDRMLAAIQDADPAGPTGQAPGTDAARWLDIYLAGLAAGLRSARAADDADEGTASPLHLVAGLITAAASSSALIPDPLGVLGTVGAAGSAHRAGSAAAEEAVAGADLHRVALAAASGATQWLEQVEPDDRAPRLLARLLHALAAATRPAPAARPLSRRAPGFRDVCADDPATNAGRPFLAEITFSSVDHAESAHRLAAVLTERGEQFGTWEAGETLGFHIHTGDPGGVIAEVYSVLTPFDLVVGLLSEG